RAHPQVVLAGVAEQERFEGGQQGHERGRSPAPAELRDLRRERRAEGQRCRTSAQALHGGAWTVGGQIEGGRSTGQGLPPPGELRLPLAAREPPPLPDGDVGIL